MNNNSGRNMGRNTGRTGNYQNRQQDQIPKKVHLEPDSNYVAKAQEIVEELYGIKSGGQTIGKITTSKLRNFLSMASDIYNVEVRRTEHDLLPSSKQALMLMRIRIAYECGRENSTNVKQFVLRTNMISYLLGIESREDFIAYSHYLEALVAFHRFYGGKE